MVPRIAHRVIAYLRPPLTFEDLIAAGTVGLVKAAKDYDPSQPAQFKTYAYIRIRGAILDELKKWDFVSPEMTRHISAANQAVLKFKQQTGTLPTEEQLADELGVTAEKLNDIMEGSRARAFLSIDNSTDDVSPLAQSLFYENQNTPDEKIEKAELVGKLAEAIAELPEKKRQTIVLYYQQNLNMKQIAEVLSITESRVSQLHAAAIFSLSAKLKEYNNGRG